MSSAYDFPETRACRGTVSIIVNVASRCGYTHTHYKQLSAMCKKLGPAGFNVIAFPVNQFGGQEPEPIHQVHSFARGYGATLPYFRINDAKVNVKGPNAHPLFQFLSQETGQDCSWNFCKYLIAPDGHVMSFYPPEVDPYRLRDKIVSVIPYVYGSYLGAFATSEEPKIVPEPKLNGRDVRYMAGKFDLSDFKPGGREDPVRFETKLQQRQARWGSASSSQVYFPPASPLGLHVPAYGPQFPDYQHPSSSNYHPYVPSQQYAAVPSQQYAAVPSQQYAAVPSQRFAFASAPLQQVQMQQPSQHVSQQQAKKAPAAAAVQESPVRPPSARQQQQQQRNVKYEVYNSGWI